MDHHLPLKEPKREDQLNPITVDDEANGHSREEDDHDESTSAEEQEEALLALIAHRTHEVEHNKQRVSYYKTQVGTKTYRFLLLMFDLIFSLTNRSMRCSWRPQRGDCGSPSLSSPASDPGDQPPRPRPRPPVGPGASPRRALLGLNLLHVPSLLFLLSTLRIRLPRRGLWLRNPRPAVQGNRSERPTLDRRHLRPLRRRGQRGRLVIKFPISISYLWFKIGLVEKLTFLVCLAVLQSRKSIRT